MYKIAYLGNFDSVPDPVRAVLDEDKDSLLSQLAQGLDLNSKVEISRYITLMPLEAAVFCNLPDMITFLIEHGARRDLAVENPLVMTAVRCCGSDVLSLFIDQAADLNVKHKRRIFLEVFWGGHTEHLNTLENAGITAALYGGDALRSAASKGDRDTVRLLLDMGADINWHEPDMVFPYASTPLIEAARQGDMETAKLLVERGADVTICDRDGDRPYSAALSSKNQDLAAWLKTLEPEQWHNEQEKLRMLRGYKAPAAMIEQLTQGPWLIEFPDAPLVRFVRLHQLMDVMEFSRGRRKYLSLLAEIDNYSDWKLLWSRTDRSLWAFDIEHEELKKLGSWSDFTANPGLMLNKMIDEHVEY